MMHVHKTFAKELGLSEKELVFYDALKCLKMLKP